MFTEFASIQLTREELLQIHAALVQRAILEDALREERDQQPVERRPLLESIETLINETDEQLQRLDHVLEDQLWEYSWYTFTDEWAHARAAQDVLKEVGPEVRAADTVGFEKKVELRYQKDFERYVGELSMEDDQKKRSFIRSTQDTPRSGKSEGSGT
jgi:DNA phosphorothioation-dependent restriction protein DptG